MNRIIWFFKLELNRFLKDIFSRVSHIIRIISHTVAATSSRFGFYSASSSCQIWVLMQDFTQECGKQSIIQIHNYWKKDEPRKCDTSAIFLLPSVLRMNLWKFQLWRLKYQIMSELLVFLWIFRISRIFFLPVKKPFNPGDDTLAPVLRVFFC